ncbi:MAG: hypothetical protein ABI601_16015 [bacterium]
MPRRISGLGICSALLLALACGGDDGSGPASTGVRIVSGDAQTDTIQGAAHEIVIEVRRRGRPGVGLAVRFERIPSENPGGPFDTILGVAPSRESFGAFVVDTTDGDGRASTLVIPGTVAGQGHVVVTCAEVGAADTATYTILPGNVARVVLDVKDTAIHVGGSYRVTGFPEDRLRNRRQDALAFSAGPNAASVSSDGTIVVGGTVGPGAVAVRAGTALDSARFLVVPAANIVFYHATARSIATSALDGSNLHILVAATTTAFPVASPTSDLVVYHQTDGLYIVDGTGARRRLLDPSVVQSALHPRFSADGRFVYFGARGGADHAPYVWRVGIDGTGLQQQGGGPHYYLDEGQVAPSPSGDRIAYVDGSSLVLEYLSTGKVVTLAVLGYFPVFSPDGSRLAYLADQSVYVANPDGSAPVRLANQMVTFDAGLTWLAGGRWLVTKSGANVLLVDATSGATFSLPGLADYSQIAGRP